MGKGKVPVARTEQFSSLLLHQWDSPRPEKKRKGGNVRKRDKTNDEKVRRPQGGLLSFAQENNEPSIEDLTCSLSNRLSRVENNERRRPDSHKHSDSHKDGVVSSLQQLFETPDVQEEESTSDSKENMLSRHTCRAQPPNRRTTRRKPICSGNETKEVLRVNRESILRKDGGSSNVGLMSVFAPQARSSKTQLKRKTELNKSFFNDRKAGTKDHKSKLLASCDRILDPTTVDCGDQPMQASNADGIAIDGEDTISALLNENPSSESKDLTNIRPNQDEITRPDPSPQQTRTTPIDSSRIKVARDEARNPSRQPRDPTPCKRESPFLRLPSFTQPTKERVPKDPSPRETLVPRSAKNMDDYNAHRSTISDERVHALCSNLHDCTIRTGTKRPASSINNSVRKRIDQKETPAKKNYPAIEEMETDICDELDQGRALDRVVVNRPSETKSSIEEMCTSTEGYDPMSLCAVSERTPAQASFNDSISELSMTPALKSCIPRDPPPCVNIHIQQVAGNASDKNLGEKDEKDWSHHRTRDGVVGEVLKPDESQSLVAAVASSSPAKPKACSEFSDGSEDNNRGQPTGPITNSEAEPSYRKLVGPSTKQSEIEDVATVQSRGGGTDERTIREAESVSSIAQEDDRSEEAESWVQIESKRTGKKQRATKLTGAMQKSKLAEESPRAANPKRRRVNRPRNSSLDPPKGREMNDQSNPKQKLPLRRSRRERKQTDRFAFTTPAASTGSLDALSSSCSVATSANATECPETPISSEKEEGTSSQQVRGHTSPDSNFEDGVSLTQSPQKSHADKIASSEEKIPLQTEKCAKQLRNSNSEARASQTDIHPVHGPPIQRKNIRAFRLHVPVLKRQYAKSGAPDWTREQLNQLHEAHASADPTSRTFWLDVASQVKNKTSKECRETWFSFAKTPKQKERRPKNTVKSVERDDLFHSTPFRCMEHSTKVNPKILDGKRAPLQSMVAVEPKTESPPVCGRGEQVGYKGYLKQMRKDVARATKDKQKSVAMPKNKVIAVYDRDEDVRIRLTPSGTLRIRRNETDDIEQLLSDDDSTLTE